MSGRVAAEACLSRMVDPFLEESMASEKPSQKANDALRRSQTEHKKLVKKVERTRRKLQKRNRKMRKLEAKIAGLERRVSSFDRRSGGQPPIAERDLRTARLIFNPISGGSSKPEYSLEKVVASLRAHGIRADVCVKISGKTARKCAHEAAEKNEALVIVAGGDGTIEDAATQLIGTKTTLGILPVGTMNNLARSLGIPLNLDDACALLGAGITRQIDVGHIKAGEKPEAEYFLESAGMGLNAIAFPAGQAVKKGKLGKLPSAIGKLFDLKPAPIEIQLDDGEIIKANSQLVTVSNAPLTGPNFLIAPEAKMDDGLFDIAVYDGMGKTELISYFMETANGKRADNPKVRFYRARHVLIRSLQEMPVVSDKDAISEHQVLDIEVVPQALTMIVGKGLGLDLPVDAVPSVPPLAGEQARADNGNEAIRAEARGNEKQSVEESDGDKNGQAPTSPPL
jgi:diacylglycerol kinase (ATP)